jgi:homospermidine synthase
MNSINNNLKTKEQRKQAFDDMKQKVIFNNKILIIGCGAVGPIILFLIIELIKINPTNIYIIDKEQYRLDKLKSKINLPINFIYEKLSKKNLEKIIINDLKFGQNDIIIECAYEINTNFIFGLCSNHGISYINSAVDVWSTDEALNEKDFTFYSRFKSIEAQNSNIQNKKNNFIISLGANPGNVNIWTLYGLEKINNIKNKYQFKSYSELAYKMGLRTIHISERDSQITSIPKKQNEYVNTWSTDAVSWYDEALSYIEIGWGTHEKTLHEYTNPKLSNEYQKIIDLMGSETFVYTYTPINKNVRGMLIRHEEAFTICRKLTIEENNKIIYKPSCYYIYSPSDSCVASLNEVKENLEEIQYKKRLMTNDIIEGRDELGSALFFEDGEIWWIGSLLDINEAREIFDNKINDYINPTILQVATGYIGGLFYLIELINNNKFMGLLLPENLPIKQFIKWTRPLLGPFGLLQVKDWLIESEDQNNKYQFNDFLIENKISN